MQYVTLSLSYIVEELGKRLAILAVQKYDGTAKLHLENMLTTIYKK